MNRLLTIGIVCVVVLVSVPQFAAAEMLVYEPFNTGGTDYAIANLDGQGPTSLGATGTWGVMEGATPTSFTVAGTGLSKLGLPTSGGDVLGGTTNKYPARSVTAAVSTATSTASDIYFSFLTYRASGTTGLARFNINSRWLDGGSVRDHRASIGVTNNNYFMEEIITNPWSNATAVTVAGYTAGTTALIIGKLTRNDSGNDTLVMWANPADFSSEAAAGAVSGTVSNRNLLTAGIGLTSFGMQSGAGTAMYSDELRIGTTWASVVPEPSSVALLVTGLLGLLAYAWRKRK